MAKKIRIYVLGKESSLRKVRINRSNLSNYVPVSRIGARGKLIYTRGVPVKRPKVTKKRVMGRRIVKKRLERPMKKVLVKKKRVLKRPKRIDKVFDKKVSKVVIQDILNIPTSEINLRYKPLLKKAMSRKGLGDLASEDVLNAMIKQENINKIKWRFEVRADVFDRDGTSVAQMIRGSGADLMSLRERMRKGIWRGAYIDYDIDVGDGYVFKLINKGNVDRVQVTIIFRS